MNLSRLRITGFAVALLALALDQASKHWLLSILPHDRPVSLLPFFDLVVAWNHGISFSMFAEHDQRWALIAMSGFIVVILGIWLWRNTYALVAPALGSVIGGALGNVADRLNFGAVADFFDFHAIGYHFPAFNIADSCIFIGVVLLCWHSMVIEPKERSKENAS